MARCFDCVCTRLRSGFHGVPVERCMHVRDGLDDMDHLAMNKGLGLRDTRRRAFRETIRLGSASAAQEAQRGSAGEAAASMRGVRVRPEGSAHLVMLLQNLGEGDVVQVNVVLEVLQSRRARLHLTGGRRSAQVRSVRVGRAQPCAHATWQGCVRGTSSLSASTSSAGDPLATQAACRRGAAGSCLPAACAHRRSIRRAARDFAMHCLTYLPHEVHLMRCIGLDYLLAGCDGDWRIDHILIEHLDVPGLDHGVKRLLQASIVNIAVCPLGPQQLLNLRQKRAEWAAVCHSEWLTDPCTCLPNLTILFEREQGPVDELAGRGEQSDAPSDELSEP
eukprot:573797-Prymnesium_polylepis.5